MLKFAFTAWNKNDTLHRFFRYDPQLMTKPAYVDYFADCLTYIIIFGALIYIVPKAREYLVWITFVWIGYLIEFYYRYNNPFSKYCLTDKLCLPIGYSTLAGFFLAVLFFREAYIILKKW